MKVRKKPVIVDAIRYTEGKENLAEILRFAKNVQLLPNNIRVKTLSGTVLLDIGDWLIKGVKGEFYPCKPDIFAETYEILEGEE